MQTTILKSFLALILILPSLSYSAVWESPNYWDQAWEEKFSEWIRSDVSRNIFKSPRSKWNGTRTDCADAAYAMRIIFSYENGLPFQMKNPSGARPEEGEAAKYLTNLSDGFDSYEAGTKRIIRFIEYIGDSVGTEHLAYHDTYATTVQSINAGHVYIYKYVTSNTRHTWIVKDRLLSGNLVLYSSTVPKVARKLLEKRGMPGSFGGRPWGFKKFKQPSFYNADYVYTAETDNSKEQYGILKKVGRGKVMSTIKKMLELEKENLGEALRRTVTNACESMKDRGEIVKAAQDFLKEKSNRCLNKQEYYDYSTPGRDKKIFTTLDDLRDSWITLLEAGRYKKLPRDLVLGLNFLSGKKFDRKGRVTKLGKKDKDGLKELNQLCLYKFEHKNKSYQVNLKDFGDRYSESSFFGTRRLSPHPNDPLLLRWGLKAKKSKCKKY